jgi:uncharacterized protein YcbK (DUF882 family)
MALACVLALAAGPFALLSIAQAPQARTISLRNIHTDDVVTVEYKRNGRYVPEAMERINWVMRDWRRNESTRMDPGLVDLLWEMHHELGSREPINIISAYRSRATNNMLRSKVGGQASESRHILGKAADVQFPDVPLRHLRYAALVRERGGVGYYPTSATPFIHVDTDRVRAWPRLPRFELALLFPSGRTQHKPAQGGDITLDDVRTARARQPDVAVQLAAFHDLRRKGREQPSMMAALAPGASDVVLTPAPRPVTAVAARPPAPVVVPQSPRLVSEPRLADRPIRLTVRPADEDRRMLTQLVALAGMPELVTGPVLAARPSRGEQTPKRKGSDPADRSDTNPPTAAESPFPRLAFLGREGIAALQGWSTGFTPSPSWDEDHPEEAAYRPFPLAPFLTTTGSVDDVALAQLVHPDLARTGELFGEGGGTTVSLGLQPPRQVARLMWSEDESVGGAGLDRLSRAASDEPRRAAERRVTTQAR